MEAPWTRMPQKKNRGPLTSAHAKGGTRGDALTTSKRTKPAIKKGDRLHAAPYTRLKTPTTIPRSIVGLKSLALTRIGAIELLAGWKRI